MPKILRHYVQVCIDRWDGGNPKFFFHQTHDVSVVIVNLGKPAKKKNCRFRDIVSIGFTRPPLRPN